MLFPTLIVTDLFPESSITPSLFREKVAEGEGGGVLSFGVSFPFGSWGMISIDAFSLALTKWFFMALIVALPSLSNRWKTAPKGVERTTDPLLPLRRK